jgi:hypothetical protein
MLLNIKSVEREKTKSGGRIKVIKDEKEEKGRHVKKERQMVKN